MMISDNWDELMLPGLRSIFNKHLKKKKDYVGELYTVEKSTKQAEYNQGTGSLGMMDEWGHLITKSPTRTLTRATRPPICTRNTPRVLHWRENWLRMISTARSRNGYVC